MGSRRHWASSVVKISSLNRNVILINKFQVLVRLRIVYGGLPRYNGSGHSNAQKWIFHHIWTE